MRSYKVVMVLSNKTEVIVACGLTHNEAVIERDRMNYERAPQTAKKIHFIVR